MKPYRITEWIARWLNFSTPVRRVERDKKWSTVRRSMLRKIARRVKTERPINAFNTAITFTSHMHR
jgi:hypothetical protein